MKHIKFLSVALLLFTAFNFTSCTEDLEPVDPAIVIPDPTDPTDPTPGPGLFEADVEGVGHFSTTNTVVFITANTITITAARPQGDNFAFMLDGTTTGTYAGNDEDNLIGYNSTIVEQDTYMSFNFDNPSENTGSVIITEIDAVNHTISGTFAFKGYSEDLSGNPVSKQITNGIFTDLPYTGASPTGDTFFAKVNGTEFVEADLLGGTVSVGAQEFIFVSAANAPDDSITVNMLSTLGVGSYPVTSPTGNVQINFTPAGDDFGTSATSGTVTITEKTATRIKGTFSTTITVGATAYVISEGAFDVEYE